MNSKVFLRAAQLLPAILVVLIATARAQPRDVVAGEARFQSGRAALERGDYAGACQEFEASNIADPATGTLLNLAACLEKLGRLAAAWQRFHEAAQQLAPDDERLAVANARIASLERRVPRLTLVLASDVPPATTVARDGVELTRGSLGVALPVDPGRHTIVVRAPGHAERRITLTVKEGESTTREIGAGARARTEPEKAPPRASSAPARGDGSAPRRTAGFVIGGIGAAALATGLATGALALGKKATVEDECSATTRVCRSSAGVDAAKAGGTFGTLSTVSFALGVAGLGIGAYLVVSGGAGRRAAALSAHALPSGGSLSLSGLL